MSLFATRLSECLSAPLMTIAMRHLSICAIGVLAIIGSTKLFAESVDETKAKLESWVKTEQLIAQETNSWEEERHFLNQTKVLLMNELASLAERLKELEASNTAADQTREELMLKRASMKKADSALLQVVEQLEQKLLLLTPRFPQPLQQKLEPLVVRIPRDASETKIPLGQRLQNLLGILTQAEKFNKTATFVGEMREMSNGQKVQVNTVYWGLAFAFYADNAGTRAGVGTPSEAGWEWTEKNENASDIKRFIDIYQRTVDDIAFVSLPVVIQ